MYLVVIGWLYVALMMAVAEAFNTNGTVLGAIVTFFLYGLMPLALVVYLMLGPKRRQAIREREAAEALEASRIAAGSPPGESPPSESSDARSVGARAPSDLPDAGGHAAGAAQTDGVAPVREEAR